MQCREFRKFIQAYLDHDLSEEVEKEWHQHLAGCSACHTNVQAYEKCLALMRRFMRDECPPKRLRERLKQRLHCDCFDFCNFATTTQHHERD
jgi:anti-sigma factor RsiW